MTLNFDQNKADPMKLDRHEIQPKKGELHVTYAKSVNEPVEDHDWQYLQPDAVLEVEPGNTYLVRTVNEWLRADFFEAGKMVGPVVYTKITHTDPKEEYLKSDGVSEMATGGTIMSAFVSVFLIMAIIESDRIGWGWIFGIIMLMIFFLLPGFDYIRRLKFTDYKKSSEALAKIFLIRNQKVTKILPPKINF